jgi:hypothetical protein
MICYQTKLSRSDTTIMPLSATFPKPYYRFPLIADAIC